MIIKHNHISCMSVDKKWEYGYTVTIKSKSGYIDQFFFRFTNVTRDDYVHDSATILHSLSAPIKNYKCSSYSMNNFYSLTLHA